MNRRLKKILRPFAISLLNLGFDLRKVISLKFYPKFKKDKSQWLKQGGKITHNFMILSDYADNFIKTYAEKRRTHLLSHGRKLLLDSDYHNTTQQLSNHSCFKT